MLSSWEKGLADFREQRWEAAETVFKAWQTERKDNTAAMYLGLLEKHRDKAGDIDWPPVSVMTEK